MAQRTDGKRTARTGMTMKSEIRNPKAELRAGVANPKPELRKGQGGSDQISAFGFRPSFGPRISAFGFTLIELLVVIAIMAILAALIFPVTAAINKVKIRSRAKSEMNQIISGIESYHAKLGQYPPDNAPPVGRWDVNQLYYELLGTK